MENFCMTSKSGFLHSLLVISLLVLALLAAVNLTAQERPVEMTVTAGDVATATAFASGIRYHLTRANTPAGKLVSLDSPGYSLPVRKHPSTAISSLPTPPAGTFYYTEELFKQSSTGATIGTTKSRPIYVNMAGCGGTVAACWGNPALFLSDLGASSMIHIVDQYTGLTTSNRYIVGSSFAPTITIYPGSSGHPTLGENDILGIVHNAAKLGGTGYGNIYHVFLPKGVDHCFDEGPCYSPDNPGTFAFCAYHFRVTFADIGNVYYTVEPYQNVGGCQLPTGTPNGQLIDSTNNVLSHELFESITDPDISTGYRTFNDPFQAGLEIGDICRPFFFSPVVLNTRKYALQAEYSNKYEACATTP